MKSFFLGLLCFCWAAGCASTKAVPKPTGLQVTVPANVTMDRVHRSVSLAPKLVFTNPLNQALSFKRIGAFVMGNAVVEFEVIDSAGARVVEVGQAPNFRSFGGRGFEKMLAPGESIDWRSEVTLNYAISEAGEYRLIAHLHLQDALRGDRDFDSQPFPFRAE